MKLKKDESFLHVSGKKQVSCYSGRESDPFGEHFIVTCTHAYSLLRKLIYDNYR